MAFWRCLIRGYQLSDEDEAAKEVIRLGESCLEQDVLEEAAEQEVRADMAGAYERTGKEETAAEWYARFWSRQRKKRREKNTSRKRRPCMSSVAERIWRWNSAPRGSKNFRRNAPFRSSTSACSARILLWTGGICAQTIREYLGRDSTLADSEEFQKLQKEYGIKVEGEEVWVGE